MAQPGFPEVGSLYHDGIINGIKVYSQPDGPGTPVLPKPPSLYPIVNQGYPQNVMSYQGLYSLGCGHWVNEPEVYKQYDPYTGENAAIICCPICGYIQKIVEPYANWQNEFYGIYYIGIVGHTFTKG